MTATTDMLVNLAWAWPLNALWLLAPLLAWWLLPAQRSQPASVAVPWRDLPGLDAAGKKSPRRLAPCLLALLAWAALVAAAMRPQWIGEPIGQTITGRDTVLAVDISGSMEVADMSTTSRRIDRLMAVKAVARQFLQDRLGDRVGLILYGDRPYLQAPLTFDRKTVTTWLDEAEIGLAGRKTAVGDAIGLAVKHLENVSEEQRVLILLTDGADTASVVPPRKAAEIAAQAGLTIYTIGVGADQMRTRSLFGTRVVNPSRDLDEDTLRYIAETTGGLYFRARDLADLAAIYQRLDELEPAAEEEQYIRPVREWFYWPLAVALLLAGGLFFWRGEGR